MRQKAVLVLVCLHCAWLASLINAFNKPPLHNTRQFNHHVGAAAQPPDKPHDKRTDAIEGIKNGCASGLAAGCVKTLLQPFDTIKTVQQFSAESMNFIEAGRLLLARSGVPALYSGLGVTIIGSMPSVGIYFGIYGYCRRKFDSSPRLSRNASIALSAGIGNLIARSVLCATACVRRYCTAGYADSSSNSMQLAIDQSSSAIVA
jgi:Mitochondrial carrier protein